MRLEYIITGLAAAALYMLIAAHVRRMWRPKRKRASRSNSRRGGGYEYRRHLLKLVELHGTRCGLCGEHIDLNLEWPHPYSLSIDHIIAVSRGGTHDIENLQLAHLQCNLAKGDGTKRVKRKRRFR